MTPKRKTRRFTQKQLTAAAADLVRRHATQLSEHFNSVQIVVTKLNPDGSTSAFSYGQGDLFARMKNTEIWLNEAEYMVRGGGYPG